MTTIPFVDGQSGSVKHLQVSGAGTVEDPFVFESAISLETYLGQQVIAGNGANQAATLPAGTKMIQVGAEGGVAYCTINGAAAVATSGKFIPENGERWIGPYDNITSLGVFAANGVSVHLIYEG